jgi:hypothetical protein
MSSTFIPERAFHHRQDPKPMAGILRGDCSKAQLGLPGVADLDSSADPKGIDESSFASHSGMYSTTAIDCLDIG